MSASLELDGKPGDVGIILSKVSFIAVSLTWPLMRRLSLHTQVQDDLQRLREEVQASVQQGRALDLEQLERAIAKTEEEIKVQRQIVVLCICA